MNNNLIEVEHISKSIKNIKILKDINFSVGKGKIVGLIGPNGAGKTTLLKILCGLNSMSAGSVKIYGLDVKDNKDMICSKVGVLIETTSGYDNLTGYENMKIIADMYNNLQKNDIESIINLLNMEDYIYNKFKTYSLGMKQKLGIAISLLNKPKLILLDEPGNGLDVDGLRDLRNLITFLAEKENIAFIVSSHIMGELDAICNEAMFLSKGEILGIVDMKNIDNGLEDYYFKIYGKETKKNEVFK